MGAVNGAAAVLASQRMRPALWTPFPMKSPLFVAALGLAQLPSLAHAQSPEHPSSPIATAAAAAVALTEVTVASSKLDKDLFTLTQSATVIDKEDIERGNHTSLVELLRNVPGIEFKQVGGPGQYSYIKLRGYTTSSLLIVVDGVSMNMPSSNDVNSLLSQIDPSTIERIEVLRGPQTVLYGANATAGVISITTKRGTREPVRSVAVEVGSLGWKKGKLTLQHAAQVGQGQLSGSLYVAKTDSDGLIDLEGFKDETVQAALDYKSKAFDAGVALMHSDNRQKYAELKEVTRTSPSSTYWGEQFADPNAYNDRTTQTFNAYLSHHISDKLNQRLEYGWTQSRRTTEDLNDGLLGHTTSPWDGFSVDYVNQFPEGAQVPVYDSGSDGQAHYRDKSSQLNYSLRYADKGLKALAGVELYDGKATQWGMWGDLNGGDKRKSLYANGEYTFSQGLTVAGGLRHDRYDAWGNKTTGSIGASQKLGNATVFGNYATSYVAPNLSQLYNPTTGTTDLKPENGKTLELGIRQNLAEQGVSWEATVWHGRVKDVIIYDSAIPNPRNTWGGYGQYNNGDQLRTRGLEFSGDYRINSAWKLKGAYTYTDSQLKKKGADFARTMLVSRHRASLGVSYSKGPLTVDTTAFYSDKRLDWTGRDWVSDYVRVDVAARYAFNRHVSVYTRIENLLDSKVQEGLGYKPRGIYGVIGLEARF